MACPTYNKAVYSLLHISSPTFQKKWWCCDMLFFLAKKVLATGLIMIFCFVA